MERSRRLMTMRCSESPAWIEAWVSSLFGHKIRNSASQMTIRNASETMSTTKPRRGVQLGKPTGNIIAESSSEGSYRPPFQSIRSWRGG